MPAPAVLSALTTGRAWPGYLRTAIAALLLAVSVASCSTGFMYNRLDRLVSWYINGLVSLDDAQEERLRTGVRQTLEWHRQSQIPKYIAFLQDVSRQAQGPVTAEMLEQRYQESTALLDDSLAHVVTDAAGLLRMLRADQVAELKASLDEENADLWKEYAGDTPQIREKRRTKNALRALQRFVGNLSTEQRALVEARLAGIIDNSQLWLERRQHWQARFFQLLQERPPAPDFEAALRDIALNPNQFDSEEYRRDVEGNRRIIMGMLAEVLNGLTPRQRAHLARKLDEYINDLREISERG